MQIFFFFETQKYDFRFLFYKDEITGAHVYQIFTPNLGKACRDRMCYSCFVYGYIATLGFGLRSWSQT
jgi:hypothetical protein